MDTINKLIVNSFEIIRLSNKLELIVSIGITEKMDEDIRVTYLQEDDVFDYTYQRNSSKLNGSVFTAQEFIDTIIKDEFIVSLKLHDDCDVGVTLMYQKYPLK
jgi:hypothetical protein